MTNEDNPRWHVQRISELERQLAECNKGLVDFESDIETIAQHNIELMQERDALAIQCQQMREALEATWNAGDDKAEYRANALVHKALALSTNPAEQIVARHDVAVLREAASNKLCKASTHYWLIRMAAELEAKNVPD